jgi:transaldolase
MNPLLELARLGQSYWLDDLTRPMIRSGKLKRRVAEQGLTGVTVNPAIFRAALSQGDAYDDQINALAGQAANSVYEALIVTDVRDACDILSAVYDRTAGRDGFVSLEVSPLLAHDTKGSIAEARRFWEAVARPNLLIKIPGTTEGVAAVEALLSEGINVNITLLFSVERYEEFARAHVSGLERRRANKAPVSGVASVASFFLSRIDIVVDEQLTKKIANGMTEARRLLGKSATANAKLAYQRFRELTSTEQWKSLEVAGARPQRLLWASTSTKNPSYDDLMYVEPLIGPLTINTLPIKTIAAFEDHGKASASLVQGLDEARQLMVDLEAFGIDMPQVARQLLEEGIQKFIESFGEILKTIEMRTLISRQAAKARLTG